MNKDRIERILMILFALVFGGVVLYFLVDKLIPVFAPFFIAWAIAFAVRAPAGRLSKSLRIPESVLRVFIAVFVTLFAFGAISFLIWQFSAMLWRFLTDIGEGNTLFYFFEALSSPSLPFFGDIFPEELSARLTEALDAVVEGILKNLGTAVTSWVGIIPGAMLFLLVTLISSVYFCIDLERINGAVKRILPEKAAKALSSFGSAAFSVAFRYLRSYLIILVITFTLMLVGFLLLGVSEAPLVATFVALLDILPVIGVGTVLLPWSIFELCAGNIPRGVGLIVLFLVNTVVRQLSEPRIVGKSIDLHPVVTLVLIYSGYALFGIVGIILVPILAVAISLLFKNNGSAEIGESAAREGKEL